MAKFGYKVYRPGHTIRGKNLEAGQTYTLAALGVDENDEQLQAHIKRGNLRRVAPPEDSTGTIRPRPSTKEPETASTKTDSTKESKSTKGNN